jgi:hypothetical protein
VIKRRRVNSLLFYIPIYIIIIIFFYKEGLLMIDVELNKVPCTSDISEAKLVVVPDIVLKEHHELPVTISYYSPEVKKD